MGLGTFTALGGTMLVAEEKRSDGAGKIRKATIWLDEQALRS